MKYMLKKPLMVLAVAGVLTISHGTAIAQLKIGVILALTGTAAPYTKSVRNTVDLFPKEIAGEKLELLIEDDRTDVAAATSIVRRFVTDNKVDLILGSVSTPVDVAVSPIADESKTLMIVPSPVPQIPGKDHWLFNTSVAVPVFAQVMVEHMKRHNVKALGVIGYPDTWGDQWLDAMKTYGAPLGIKVVSEQRFSRVDTSVTAQVLQLMSHKPDAILVVASYAGAAVPQIALVERHYPGIIYHTHGVDRSGLMKAAGKAAEGAVFPQEPAGVAESLPTTYPTREKSLAFVKEYEEKYGAGTRTPSAGNMYDAIELLRAAVPVAKNVAGKPGTPEFRLALRDAIENAHVVGSNPILYYTPTNHEVTDKAGAVMVTVRDGKWVLEK